MSRVLRVLVADDDALIADTLAQILTLNGIDAVAVHSGEAATRLVCTFRPDAVILDVIMPHLNGIETALAILHALPECRVILLSGDDETSAPLAEAARLGHKFNIFAKPVPPLELIEALGSDFPRARR